MAQYPIPQFIEEEGKIVFFLTFRQFFWLVGGGALCVVLFFVLPLLFFIVAALLVMGTVSVMAFVKIDNTPVLIYIFNALGFATKTKNYTWQKKEFTYPFKKRPEIKSLPEDPYAPKTPTAPGMQNPLPGTTPVASKLREIKKIVETKK